MFKIKYQYFDYFKDRFELYEEILPKDRFFTQTVFKYPLKYNYIDKGSVYIYLNDKIIGTDVGDGTFEFTESLIPNLRIDYEWGFLYV